jgi:hypothetical protein
VEELTEEQKLQEQKDFIQNEIDGLKIGKKFPETVKKLTETPEWKEVINDVYMDGFAKDLVRSYENYDEEQQKVFDEEYKVRSRFFNTILAWAEGADKANEQIKRYQEMLDSVGKEGQQAKEPTIGTK